MERKNSHINDIEAICPDEKFYSSYTTAQINDLITSLETYSEIPRQYNYFNNGAQHWNSYIKSLSVDQESNTLTNTIELLDRNIGHIFSQFSKNQDINVLDVGAGNAYPVKLFLQNMINTNRLGRYIALDISATMLQLARQNIKSWFGDTLDFYGYEYDVTKDKLPDFRKSSEPDKANLILILGGTLSNLRDPDIAYRMIREGMKVNDVIVHIARLDSQSTRACLDFNSSDEAHLSPNHRTVFDLLNIREDFYNVEKGYDSLTAQRYIRVRLKLSIEINFSTGDGYYPVRLHKGRVILVWRSKSQTATDFTNQFLRNNFKPIYAVKSKTRDYMISICRI